MYITDISQTKHTYTHIHAILIRGLSSSLLLFIIMLYWQLHGKISTYIMESDNWRMWGRKSVFNVWLKSPLEEKVNDHIYIPAPTSVTQPPPPPTHTHTPTPHPHKHRKFGYDCLRILKEKEGTISLSEIKILVVTILGHPYNKENYLVQCQVTIKHIWWYFSCSISFWVDKMDTFSTDGQLCFMRISFYKHSSKWTANVTTTN